MTNIVQIQDKKDLVLSELRKVPGAKIGVETTLINCPFHADRTPSCAVFYKPTDRDPGRYYCFSCGAKGCWDTLASALGLQQYDPKPKDEFLNPINLSLPEQKQSFVPDKLQFSELPKNKLWRHIPTNLLIEIGCKVCNVVYSNYISPKFVYLPIFVDGVLKGYTKGKMKKELGKTSYINAKGSWVKDWGLFPFDYSIKLMEKCSQRTIVLVEGQRDALRLLQHGIPALCIMGTHNWTDRKKWLLETHGVERVVVMMDGDDAGIDATNSIFPSLQGVFDNVNVIKLWKLKNSPYLQVKDCEQPSKEAKKLGLDLWDPGNCPVSILDKIKELYL